MTKQSVIIGMVVFGACITAEIAASKVPTFDELKRMTSQRIEGAKVSTFRDAERLTFNAYLDKTKGAILANEGADVITIITLGLDVSDFGSVGDKAWEARFSQLLPDGTRGLRAILWVHAETEKVHFLIGPWNE